MITAIWREGLLSGFNKPDSIHSIGPEPGTLQSQIAEYWSSMGIPLQNQPEEAGLISRLDFLTSGLIFACADPSLRDNLMQQTIQSKMEKFYLAVCSVNSIAANPSLSYAHHAEWLSIESAFRAFGPGRKLVKACAASDQKSKHSSSRIYRTDILELGKKGSSVLFLCRIKGGFRHQIRVHLSSLGYPIEGDPLYNQAPEGRLRLHSYGARFVLPDQDQIHTVFCPPPNTFVPFLEGDSFFLTLEKSRSLMSTW